MSDNESPKADENKNEIAKISWHSIILLSVAILSIIIAANVNQNPESMKCDIVPEKIVENKPNYWVYSQTSNVESETGILKHVHLVLNRSGFIRGTNNSNWDLLWSHDYPFRILYPQLKALKKHQMVNHFPGTGYITSKVEFATTDSKYIPKAFKIPEDSNKFSQYVVSNPNTMFVLKDNQHRRVVLKNASEIDLKGQGNFVQEYIAKPYLVDGHKFDIGVYTILTSVDPLRVYIYKGDALFRYCPSKYYPFDPLDLDKYVIGDDYLPTWEVPSLAPLYTAMGYSMKESFNAYVRSQGKDPSIIWKQIDDSIIDVFKQKERFIISALKNYRSGVNFFELMRFDFVIDEDLKLYALEANMSPNLSSAHYPPNQLLYEQVLYSVLSLVGVARYTHAQSLADRNIAESNMRVTDKNIVVWADTCASKECRVDCEGVCEICRHCLTPAKKQMLSQTVIEQLNRNDCRRIYPPSMIQGVKKEDIITDDLSANNRLMHVWLQGKCNDDITWCN